MEKVAEIGMGLMKFGMMFLLIAMVFYIGNYLLKWVTNKLREWKVDEDVVGYLSVFITLALMNFGMGTVCLLVFYWR